MQKRVFTSRSRNRKKNGDETGEVETNAWIACRKVKTLVYFLCFIHVFEGAPVKIEILETFCLAYSWLYGPLKFPRKVQIMICTDSSPTIGGPSFFGTVQVFGMVRSFFTDPLLLKKFGNAATYSEMIATYRWIRQINITHLSTTMVKESAR